MNYIHIVAGILPQCWEIIPSESYFCVFRAHIFARVCWCLAASRVIEQALWSRTPHEERVRNLLKQLRIKKKKELKNHHCSSPVHTLDRDKVSRWTAHIAAGLRYDSIDVAALNETRLTDEDSLQEIVSGYMVGWGFFLEKKTTDWQQYSRSSFAKEHPYSIPFKNLLEYFKCYTVLCHL